MSTTLTSLRSEYQQLYNTVQIRPQWQQRVNDVVQRIKNNQQKYQKIAQSVNVRMPWYFPGIIHSLESSFSEAHLHNGDSLKARTTHVPKGRPLDPPKNGWQAGYTFEESAIDALKLKHFDQAQYWDIPAQLWRLEAYNGFGYRNHNINSPYLWSGTNHYSKGKYVADGKFDPNAVSAQVGAAATIYTLMQEQEQPIMFNLVEALANVADVDLATNQLEALKWLESKIPSEQWEEFQRLWSDSSARLDPEKYTLKTKVDTVFKLFNVPSPELAEHEKVNVAANQEFSLSSYEDIGTHVKITLANQRLDGRKTWTAYEGHIEIYDQEGIKVVGNYQIGDRLPTEVNLNIPYFSQRDNRYEPVATCNVTSVAMCMAYFGIKARSRDRQLEDELYLNVTDEGQNPSAKLWHNKLHQLFIEYGLLNTFKTDATWAEVKTHLANGKPVIYSGKLTHSGHIIVLRGYGEYQGRQGFWANDPFGEHFNGPGAGFYKNVSGENLHYSESKLFKASYGGSNTTWAHFPEARL